MRYIKAASYGLVSIISLEGKAFTNHSWQKKVEDPQSRVYRKVLQRFAPVIPPIHLSDRHCQSLQWICCDEEFLYGRHYGLLACFGRIRVVPNVTTSIFRSVVFCGLCSIRILNDIFTFQQKPT